MTLESIADVDQEIAKMQASERAVEMRPSARGDKIRDLFDRARDAVIPPVDVKWQTEERLLDSHPQIARWVGASALAADSIKKIGATAREFVQAAQANDAYALLQLEVNKERQEHG